MEKPISRQQHGFTDYSYVPLMAAAPALVGFEDQSTAVTLTRVLSGSILATSLLTRAEWGLARVIPFKGHLIADTAVGLFALSAPWLFGFSGHTKARNTFLVAGAFGMMAGLLSGPEEMPPVR
ncbi:MAG: hypothetical protein EOO39_17370 [Cytophagaceae bacterium]|nr:MAG: hypothetical protein EOO39_17370 [Cytophagaceae bacterium]